MSTRAKGTFEITMTPHPPYDTAKGATIARASIDKKLEGELTATSKVEMISAMSEVKGSAGYVAIERINGTLNGRTGTFVVQHMGTMSRGTQSLTIHVVPDTGTGELEGLTGKMAIDIVEGKHFYTLDYDLPSSAPIALC
jgi:hypothetical protein